MTRVLVALLVFTFALLAGAGLTSSQSHHAASVRACKHYRVVNHHRVPCVAPTPVPTPTPTPLPASGPKPSSCDYQTLQGCTPVPAPGSCHYRPGGLPDQRCTPGATNPAVTPQTAGGTICVHGYTATIRPPVTYTGPLKLRLMQAYGLNPADAKLYELDHLIPLEGGGAAADPANLWPQAYSPAPGAHQKDDEENFLRSVACGGNADRLVALQAAIASDWVAAWQADNPPHSTFGKG